MKLRHLYALILGATLLPPTLLPAAWAEPIPLAGSAEVFFSPDGGATDAIVREIRGARQEILVLAYSFTSAPIAKALVDAHKRGVRVVAVLDKGQRSERYTGAKFLKNAGIPVLIDAEHDKMHNKVLIIDRSALITGSFNFSKGAEKRNAENLLVIRFNKPLVQRYISNFELHQAHSEQY